MKYVRKSRQIPHCLHCGDKISYGRTDKKFCCEECRMEHYNSQAKDRRAFRRRVLSRLSSNYELLSVLVQSGVESISLADFVAMGFVPGVVTSYARAGRHDEFACFDIKYRMTATKIHFISKIQNVSLHLQPGNELDKL